MTNTASRKLKLIRERAPLFEETLKSCSICPRRCGVDRTTGKAGYCRAPYNPVLYSYSFHHGEEPAISGTKGSGTIFFTHCNMRCVYCQNYYFSQLDSGKTISIAKLADIMLHLQEKGCHNINLVSPTHYVPQIVIALEAALSKGLDIPVVYNTGGYDLVDTIRLLDGIIDIYLPDMRYLDDDTAKKYSGAIRYVENNRTCVKEMQRQVGDLAVDGNGIAKSGLIIRLLALPQDSGGVKKTLKFIKENISKNAYLSIMSQYYPTFKAHEYEELSSRVRPDDYKNIVDEARRLGLNNGWIQEAPMKFDERFFGTNMEPNEFKSA